MKIRNILGVSIVYKYEGERIFGKVILLLLKIRCVYNSIVSSYNSKL